MPELSVVVPIYNVEDYLLKCLESIRNQTFRDFECFLVNDGSKDKSGHIAHEFAEGDARFKVIDKINGGLSDARNCGLKQASGKYIYFVDSDDFLELNCFEKCIDKLHETGADMVIFDIYQYFLKTNTKEIIANVYEERDVISLKNNPDLMCRILNAAWNKMYKRELFTKEGILYPYGRYYEDLGTTYRLLLNCERVAFIRTPLYNYLADRPGNITQSFNNKTYHVLDMVKLNIDYYKSKGVYETYYEELKFLGGINIMECLKKTRNVTDKELVDKYIDDCFTVIKSYWPEFPKCKYKICRQKNDWIYADKLKLKSYLKIRQLWH